MARRPKPPPAVAADQPLQDPVIVALIRRAAAGLCRRPGFTPSDRTDIEQTLFAATHRARRRFRPARGTWLAFAATVIARRAASLARDRAAPRRAGRMGPLRDLGRDGRRPMPSIDPAETVPLALDVEQVLAAAPPNLRALAERLMAGERVTAAARDLEVARSTVRGWVGQLRQRFEDLRLLEG
jgi:DNA-directed RNA polymerase specialized sigma24 family protein